MTDAEILQAIESLERFREILTSIERPQTIKLLRSLLSKLEELPHIENEVNILVTRLRRKLAQDPDKTPRHSISTQDLAQIRLEKK